MSSEEERLAAEANRLYWRSELAVREIADRLGVGKSTLYRAVEPEPAGPHCEECGTALIFSNRSARDAGEAECPGCGMKHDLAAAAETGKAAERAEPAEAGARAAERADGRDAGEDRSRGGAEQGSRAGASAAPRGGAAAGSDAGPVPIRTEDALRRSRALVLAGAAAAGLAVGALAAVMGRRR